MGSLFKQQKSVVEKVPGLIKRCPKCGNLSLEFDVKTGRVYCARCCAEEHLVKQGCFK